MDDFLKKPAPTGAQLPANEQGRFLRLVERGVLSVMTVLGHLNQLALGLATFARTLTGTVRAWTLLAVAVVVGVMAVLRAVHGI